VARDELAELGAKFDVHGRVGEPSSQRMFDAGRPGLDFFREFGPVYARYRGVRFDVRADIESRYDGQREIAFGKLRADADRLTAACAEMSEVGIDFRNSVNSIFAHWQGTAAEAAHGQLSSFQSGAAGVWTRLRAFADALTVACDTAERIAFDRANAVLRLAAEQVGGRTAKEIEVLVDCAGVGEAGRLTDRQITDLAALCDIDVTPALCRTNPDVLAMAIDAAGDWLDTTFVPFYELRMDAFEMVCACGDADLDLVWRGLSGVMDSVRDNDFHALAKQFTPQAAVRTEPVVTTGNSAPVTSSVTQRLNPGAATVPDSQVRLDTGAQVIHGPQPNLDAQSNLDAQPNPGPPVNAGVQPNPGTPPDPGTPPEPGSVAGVVVMAMDPISAPSPAPPAHSGAAPTVPAGGYGYLPVAAPAAGGGAFDHQRKVTIRGKPVEEVAATPTAIGAEDDPAAYNESIWWQDDEPAPIAVVPTEPKPEPAEELVWQLGEDGELRQIKAPQRKEGKDD
jgi:uncharacterized protein YukE